jgi:dihydrofolate synthase/folylpolyglutamate synthase
VVARQARVLYLVEPNQSRACSFADLERLMPPNLGGVVSRASVADLFPAPGVCVAGDPGDTVVVTGSLYLVGETLVRLEPGRGPSDDDLQDF